METDILLKTINSAIRMAKDQKVNSSCLLGSRKKEKKIAITLWLAVAAILIIKQVLPFKIEYSDQRQLLNDIFFTLAIGGIFLPYYGLLSVNHIKIGREEISENLIKLQSHKDDRVKKAAYNLLQNFRLEKINDQDCFKNLEEMKYQIDIPPNEKPTRLKHYFSFLEEKYNIEISTNILDAVVLPEEETTLYFFRAKESTQKGIGYKEIIYSSKITPLGTALGLIEKILSQEIPISHRTLARVEKPSFDVANYFYTIINDEKHIIIFYIDTDTEKNRKKLIFNTVPWKQCIWLKGNNAFFHTK